MHSNNHPQSNFMNFSFFVLLSLAGTLLAALVSCISAKGQGHRAVMTLLALSTGLGAIASAVFLLSGQSQLAISQSVWFFSTPFALSTLSALFFFLLNTVACLASVYAIKYVEQYAEIYNVRVLDGLMAIFVLGMQGVLLSSAPFGFLVFWEVMSISSFFLVMADKQAASVRAALFYLIMTHLGAGAILAGFLILSGSSIFEPFTRLAVLAQSLPPQTLFGVFLLFLFGFGSKAGLVPFHCWLPEAHPQAPSHISALMSGVMLKMAVYGFLRVVFIFLPSFGTAFGITILSLGLLSAVIDRDIKRTLAFSSIENIGLIFTFIGLGFLAFAQGSGLLGNILFVVAIFHCLVHAIFKSGLFLTSGVIVSEVHTRRLEAMGGLAKRMPFVTGIFCALALGAAALPPFGAFYSEWMGIQAIVGSLKDSTILLQAASTLTLIGVAFVGGMAVFALVKLFAMTSLGEPRTKSAEHAKDVKGLMGFSLFASAILFLLAGLFAPFLLKLIGAEPLTGMTGVFPSLLLPTPTNLSGSTIQPLIVFVLLVLCFFFRWLLRTKKTIVAIPVIETNPWIARRYLTLNLRSIWMDYLYEPLERGCLLVASKVKNIQSGSIQFYLFLIFLAL